MTTMIYGLFNCRSESDASQCWGDIVFTCDTMDMVKKFADNPDFKKSLRITSEYEWEDQNNGERAQSPVTTTLLHEEYLNYFVIAQIPHNPTEGNRF